MDYSKIIELADNREPNQFDTGQKLMWLQVLGERIEKETGYVTRAACHRLSGTEGMALEQEIYVQYLMAQINAANGETERYNRCITLFNEMYAAFLSHLIRKSHGLKANFTV